MQAIVYTTYGGPEVTAIQTIPKPTPQAGELLVRVAAGGLNPVDAHERSGEFKMVRPFKFPQIVGNEFAGTVEAIGPAGSSTASFAIGDTVMVRVSDTGALAEYMTVRASYCSHAPKSIPLVDAGGLPLVSLTAWQVLDALNIAQGDRVLITAGSGAVGLFAIQIAKMRGAVVVATASASGAPHAKAAGADDIIDYTTTTPEQYIANGGEQLKFDKVFDGAGGDDAAMSSIFAATKRGGKVITIFGPITPDAFSNNPKYQLSGLKKWLVTSVIGFKSRTTRNNAAAAGISYEFMFNWPDGASLQKIADLVDEGKLKHQVDSRYKFEDFKQAFERLESKKARGKVIVEVSKSASSTEAAPQLPLAA